MSKPFNVTLIQPQGYIFSAALKEAAEYLCAMLQQCGFDAQLSTNELRPGAYNVILCAHLLGASDLPRIPRDSIVFNSEPLGKGDHWHFASDTYSRILARFHVWDYAERNLARIDHARKDTIPFWYCRQLVRTRSPARRLRSLLFYGAPTPWRRALLSEIAAKGIEVKFMHGMYDAQRDAEMFAAWAVLNLHKTDDNGVFEPIRCFYPLTNRVPVISEEVRGDATADEFRDSMFFFDRQTMADRILALYDDDRAFAEQTAAQARNFESKSAQGYVRAAAQRFLQSVQAG
jgi:hypothetical protein